MNEKVTVITGASSGIGEALAKQLGAKGHRLVLGARRENELKRVAGGIGSNAIPVTTDVTRRKDVEHLKDVALERFGHVDVWVNNAGRGITKSVMELTDQEFDEIVAVVLKSVFYGMQTIVPHFQERGQGTLDQRLLFLGQSAIDPLQIDLQCDEKRRKRVDCQPSGLPEGKVSRNPRFDSDARGGGH